MNNIYNKEKIGERIAQSRKELKYSQEELSEKCYCVRQTIAKWEKGMLLPSIDDFVNLCNIFNCDIGYLLCEYNTKRHISADICKETGLEENSVTVIRNISGSKLKILNLLLQNKNLESNLMRIYGLAYFTRVKELFEEENKEYHKTPQQLSSLASTVYGKMVAGDFDREDYSVNKNWTAMINDVVAKFSLKQEIINPAKEYHKNSYIKFYEMFPQAKPKDGETK